MAASREALSRYLARLQRHSPLSGVERQAILHLGGEEVRYAAYRDIARPGDHLTYSTLVTDGIIGRFDLMRSGARQITGFYVTGDMADLHSLVVPTISWGLTSLNASTIIRIPHQQLRHLAEFHANLAMAFWRDSTLDAAILAKWISNIGRKDARARLAHLFCELGVRLERAGLGTRDLYDLSLKQEQLGDATGLTAVHVNRTLTSLRKDGLVRMQHRKVIIPSWDALIDVAEFSPRYLLASFGDLARSEDAA